MASFAKKNFGKDAHITLFKDPYELLDAIKHKPPNILGCSNYTWNSNLSYQISSLAKQYSPETLTLWGGTNYPFDEKNQEKFLRRRKNLDIHIFYEGEQAFSEVIGRALSVPAHKILSGPIN